MQSLGGNTYAWKKLVIVYLKLTFNWPPAFDLVPYNLQQVTICLLYSFEISEME